MPKRKCLVKEEKNAPKRIKQAAFRINREAAFYNWTKGNNISKISIYNNLRNMFKKIFFFAFVLSFFLLPFAGLARDLSQATDWYIKNFNSDIVVNSDSSLLITEKIVADCGNLPNKHGIFRVLPTEINTTAGKIKTPVELISITNFLGNPYEYQASRGNGTITWKIGDADKTVTGINEYKIVYKVKNAVREQNGRSELYWNLNGNFWQIETDNYSAEIKFPAGVNRDNTNIQIYSGSLGAKGNDLADAKWAGNILHFQSKRTLAAGVGITVSAAMPTGIFTAYVPTISDQYPDWPWILMPFAVFIICLAVWKKYGQDPAMRKTVIAEYEAPDNLGPLEVGLIHGSGSLSNKFITAAIIQMAVDKILTITETETKVLLVPFKDYRLEKTNNSEAVARLLPAEKRIYEAIFDGKTVSGSDSKKYISEMKNKFYKAYSDINKKCKAWLTENEYMDKAGFKIRTIMSIVGGFFVFVVFLAFKDASPQLLVSAIVSSVIITIFAALMVRRTPKGAETAWKIKGFKLFINTAEKYRARFYEKENMFEKVLPYAIVFGLTKKWIEKTRAIYGDDKFLAMAPAWYVSTGGFNADSFTSSMNSVATAIAGSVSSPSGQSGAGGAGGGGGGGGGGGW